MITHDWVNKIEIRENRVGRVEISKNLGLVNGPEIVCNDIASKDRECSIRRNGLNSLNHALLEGDWRIAEGISKLASRIGVVSWRIIRRIRAATDWLRAVVIGTNLVRKINVSITDVNDLNRRLSASDRALRIWLWLWERYGIWGNLWVGAKPNKGGT